MMGNAYKVRHLIKSLDNVLVNQEYMVEDVMNAYQGNGVLQVLLLELVSVSWLVNYYENKNTGTPKDSSNIRRENSVE